MALTSISNRLTPSVPIEVTYGAQPVATGRKYTTLFGHRAASGGSAQDYGVHEITNVGDPTEAKAEAEALTGTGSQLSKMVEAFVKANAFAGRSNFPAFRIVVLPNAVTTFGPSDEALEAINLLRSDMLVSCYPASDSTNKTKLIDFATLISGPDRDLNGQFGSFCTFGSIDDDSAAFAYNMNSRYAIVAWLQDTNTALIDDLAGASTSGSPTLTGFSSTVGIYAGATITGTGVPANTFVGSTTKTTVSMVDANGEPVNATATGSTTFDFQNVVSQSHEIVAAAHAAGMMSSAFPYNPLQNVQIGGLVAPKKSTDLIVFDPNGLSELALVAGLSPIATLADGTLRFVRTRTTYTTLPGNITVTDYFDWQQIVVLYDFREDCYQIGQLPPFNNNPGGTKASQTIAAKFKDEVLRQAQAYEDRGAFQNVQLSAKKFVVQVSTTSRGRFDFKIPVDVIPGLYVIAGNIVGVSDLVNFTI